MSRKTAICKLMLTISLVFTTSALIGLAIFGNQRIDSSGVTNICPNTKNVCSHQCQAYCNETKYILPSICCECNCSEVLQAEKYQHMLNIGITICGALSGFLIFILLLLNLREFRVHNKYHPLLSDSE